MAAITSKILGVAVLTLPQRATPFRARGPARATRSLCQLAADGIRRDISDPVHLPRLLCLHSEWRKRETDNENDRKADQPHAAAESNRTPRRAPAWRLSQARGCN